MKTKFYYSKGLIAGFIFSSIIFLANKANAQNCNTDVTNGIASSNITASGDNAPGGTKAMAFDNVKSTKWQTLANTGYLQVDLGTAVIITNYSLTSANDSSTRDPKDFNLSGSNDGVTFTTLDTRTSQVFATRSLTQYYSFSNSTAYRYYRLTITANNGDVYTQLAEMQLMPTSNCIVGNVYNGSAGVGYPSIPVLVRTTLGTTASTTTNASGNFAFTTAQAPDTDYAVLIQPPANTYFASGPAINLNKSVMSSSVFNYAAQELWPTGAFLNVNGDGNSIAGTPYMIDDTEGVKTPASLDWVLKPSVPFSTQCTAVSTTLEGNGTFGNLSTTDFIAQHSFQPGFHTGPILNPESHPTLFKAFTTSTTSYGYQNVVRSFGGALYFDGTYNITSFLGTIQDVGYTYGRSDNTSSPTSSFSLLNGNMGGWRKTYGHTTGDPYDQFIAANGKTGGGTIVQFTANIATTGTKYLNFYGKNANSFLQNINTPVQLLFSVYDNNNVLINTATLTLSPAASAADDDPKSPWQGRSVSFNAATTGTYTFVVSVPPASAFGNDFYIDDIILSDCSVQNILSGTVWDDANADITQSANEAGTNAGGLFVNLIDASGNVVTSVPVNTDGTYSISVPQNLTGYSLVLTTSATSNTPALPANWVNTGENVNTSNTATQNSTLGVIQLTTLTSDIIGQNFGIEQLPTSNNVTQNILEPSNFTIPAGTISKSVAGNDAEDGTLSNSTPFVVTSLPTNAVMYYNGVQVTLNQTITNFNPALLSFTNISLGATSVAFNYSFIDAGGKQSPSPATYSVNWITPLPISLLSFKITQINCDEIKLYWQVSSAVNFNRFEIQRSADNGTDYSTIGTIDYSSQENNYSWQDEMPSSGSFEYRLKMIDLDGKFNYSTILLANSTCNTAQVFPNPVKRGTNLTISVHNIQSEPELIVYSVDGSVIQRKKLNSTTSSLSTGNMAVGVYYFSIRNSNGTIISKGNFIIQ